jgi:hypothetical protein
MGSEEHHEMSEVEGELRFAIPAVFDSEDYRTRRKLVEGQFAEAGEKAFAALAEKARSFGRGAASANDGARPAEAPTPQEPPPAPPPAPSGPRREEPR